MRILSIYYFIASILSIFKLQYKTHNFTSFIPNYKKIIQIPQKSLNELIIENKKLKEEIKVLKGVVQDLKSDNLNIIEKLQNKYNNLKNSLILKEEEISYLKSKLLKFEPTCNINDIIVVNFVTSDKTILGGIKCFLDETFAEVEERLYKKFKIYRNTNNEFLLKYKTILRFKKLFENGIYDGAIVTLVEPDE